MESSNLNSQKGETVCSKSVKESSLDYETNDMHAIENKMSKSKERCMTYFKSLHSYLQVLSNEDLKGTRIEHGFKRAFISLFGQDFESFTSTMFLYVDQLKKQLDKDEFQEDGSMAAFWYFLEYTRIEAKEFKDTLLQHTSSVKKSIAKRTRHRRQYDRRVNKRQMQTQESKVDMGKALDACLVVTESSGTQPEKHDTSSGPGNDTHAEDADNKPVNDKELMDNSMPRIQ
ncbi:hypothetical protein Tco_1144078 [Tanacetum coccineum]